MDDDHDGVAVDTRTFQMNFKYLYMLWPVPLISDGFYTCFHQGFADSEGIELAWLCIGFRRRLQRSDGWMNGFSFAFESGPVGYDSGPASRRVLTKADPREEMRWMGVGHFHQLSPAAIIHGYGHWQLTKELNRTEVSLGNRTWLERGYEGDTVIHMDVN
ncbi:hypothetical protein B0H19DRAFT_1062124 [Mycena capillaripes]|nr:hypothetical protein B0H19DRAFT_1062124 [Mycena capillaripes]